MVSMLQNIEDQLRESARIKEEIRERYAQTILHTAELMINCYKSGGKLLICGNGGSAADSQHFAAEMIGRLKRNRGALPAIALTTDSSILTALANDFSFDVIFRKQVEALGRRGDVLIGLSTSGNSMNVMQAMEAAKIKGLHTIALVGKDGGTLAAAADHAIVIPSNVSQRIQEGHITIIHIWCDLIEDAMFPV